ncbi:conjugative coupling factor TraD, PFGI-1 class [Vibrio genomosp. F10 str. ZF-129]|uniref:Conjugative coupling factor TraD, PFGI-1 class n=1 Tax=Vibrio genomosp. F10 str. ZF-129 TaxID=1187848 RepID=A0A1E5BG41_9VIBR|nr:type IV conjugative transfer system coupling protein TraD [Vibrio genomosp. F10]OEE34989.1 conjugative coupling factor TraD, PFGI-1 class [Vibrio genomosp. F10 str. ZF-129]
MADKENLFRPAVERNNACALAAASLVLWTTPWMIPTNVAHSFAIVTGILAIREYRSAKRVIDFQKYIRNPRKYVINPREIPKNDSYLWLGLGFQWKTEHTQRLYDSRNEPFYTSDTPTYTWFRQNEVKAGYKQHLRMGEQIKLPFRKVVARYSESNSAVNFWKKNPDLGGYSAIHGIEPDEVDCLQDIGERNGHTLCIGTTRVGKTRTAEMLIAQDIARRGKDGDFEAAVAIFDPKGDGDLLARAQIEALRNNRQFYMIHLGFPDISARYNGVADFNRVSECATRTAGQLDGSGDGAAFKEFVWRFINIISQALFSMGETVSFDKINQYIQHMELLFIRLAEDIFRQFESKIDYLDNWELDIEMLSKSEKASPHDRALSALSAKGLAIYKYLEKNHTLYDDLQKPTLSSNLRNLLHCVTHYDSTYFSKITASLLPLLEKLCSGRVSELIAPDYEDLDDPRPIITWPKILREKAVIYIGLDAMQDTAVATAVGNTLFADLLSTSGQIYKFGDKFGIIDADHDQVTSIYVHADEFNELVGDEFLPLCNKAGGSGVKLVCYTQSRFDLDVKVGSDKSEVILSNFNTLIMMRVKTKNTAAVLTEQLEEVRVRDVLEVSGTTTTLDGDFTAKNEDRTSTTPVPMIAENEIMSLPKGQAFVLLNGNKLLKVRFPMLEDDKNCPFAAKKQSQIVKLMKEKYDRGMVVDEWWKSSNDEDWRSGFTDRSANFEWKGEAA